MQTFVVRVYEQEGTFPQLCGVVKQVANGQTATFHDVGELLALLTRRATHDVSGGDQQSQGTPWAGKRAGRKR